MPVCSSLPRPSASPVRPAPPNRLPTKSSRPAAAPVNREPMAHPATRNSPRPPSASSAPKTRAPKNRAPHKSAQPKRAKPTASASPAVKTTRAVRTNCANVVTPTRIARRATLNSVRPKNAPPPNATSRSLPFRRAASRVSTSATKSSKASRPRATPARVRSKSNRSPRSSKAATFSASRKPAPARPPRSCCRFCITCRPSKATSKAARAC